MGQSIPEWPKYNFLKAVCHIFYLVRSWILNPICLFYLTICNLHLQVWSENVSDDDIHIGTDKLYVDVNDQQVRKKKSLFKRIKDEEHIRRTFSWKIVGTIFYKIGTSFNLYFMWKPGLD